MQKKFSKIFTVPNDSLGHTDELDTYKHHVEHVSFTEKRQKLSKIAILQHFVLSLCGFGLCSSPFMRKL